MSHEDSVRRTMGYVGTNLRLLRRQRGLTQENVAALAGIEVRHLSELENARRTPSFGLLVTLADVLEVETADLFAVRPAGRVPRGRPRKDVLQQARETEPGAPRPNPARGRQPTGRAADAAQPGQAPTRRKPKGDARGRRKS